MTVPSMRQRPSILSAVLTLALVLASLSFSSEGAWGAAGDLDPSFGNGGKVTTTLAASYSPEVVLQTYLSGLVLQADGKVVAVGYAADASRGGSNNMAVLVRYNPDGTLDQGFGSGGVVTTALGVEAYANAVVQQHDGKLVTAGNVSNGGPPSNDDFLLVRYNLDGSLDTGFGPHTVFGTPGTVETDINNSLDYAKALVLQPDGKLVAAGLADSGSNPDFPYYSKADFALARYNADGSLDGSFGVGGKVITDVNSGSLDYLRALVLQPDGKLVAAGLTANGKGAFGLVRYNADGSLDETFGVGGKLITNITSNTVDYPEALALQPDGKLVAAGFTGNGTNGFALVRYNADGSLDTSFGVGGKVTTDIGSSDASAHALLLQPNGKLVAAGNSNGNFALVRYNPDGSLDGGFGNGGTVTTAFTTGAIVTPIALGIQADGKLVAAGTNYVVNDGELTQVAFALVRYLGAGPCLGDCSGDGVVSISELISGVDIALGEQPVKTCPAFASGSGMVGIAQLVTGVRNALNGCDGA